MKGGGTELKVLKDLSNLGLIHFPSQNMDRSSVKFYVTSLLQHFLVSQIGSALGGAGGAQSVSKGIDPTLLDS